MMVVGLSSFLTAALLLLGAVDASTMTGAKPVKNLKKAHAAETKVTKDGYDYIIAGGGLAGCLLAERLTRDGSKRVLLLEAGSRDFNNFQIQVPAGVLRLFRSGFDWQFESGGEKFCNGRPIFLQRGRVLGGSSCTNLCLYFRGTAKDYDDWGVPGWTAKDVFPYFLQVEKDRTGRSPEMHGKKGEWIVEEVPFKSPLSKRFLEVAAASGIDQNDDFNDWTRPQDGVGRFPKNLNKGRRVSGATAFLKKAVGRKNLEIRTKVMAKRIVFNEDKTAIGVDYDLVGDDSYEFFTAKLNAGGEVLVCGGAIGSPQLLMCSGIGPAKDLRDLGISVVHDNPFVGKNLQDHPAVTAAFKVAKRGVSITSKFRLFGYINPFAVARFVLLGSGPLTSTGCDHGAFIKTNPSVSQPDLQLRFVSGMAPQADGMKAYVLLKNERKLPDGFTIQPVAIRAKSTGTVRLASANAHVRPMIDAGYLSNPADLATLRNGIKIARELAQSPEWKELLGKEVFPGPQYQTDDELDEYIRETLHTSNALVGTCKMGVGKDAVVDEKLRVYGVKGVRVVDSSIMPTIPGGQTGTPVVMIAERAAAFLLEEQKPQVTA